jgi:molybdenum cofactor cytidylyltransferase
VSDLWGILLAAGNSSRYGADKLLQPLDGGVPMAVLAARHLLRALPNAVAVVRNDRNALSEQLRAEGIGLVVNPGADEGMGTSLACGVRATPQATGWVIALADMPWIDSRTVHGVAQLLRAGARIVAPVYLGQRGHPVGFSRELRDELGSLSGDVGARAVLARHTDALQLFEVNDPGIVRDIDTPADLAPAG